MKTVIAAKRGFLLAFVAAACAVVERFPDAFLPGGAFVSRAYDRTDGQILVRKYSLTAAPRP